MPHLPKALAALVAVPLLLTGCAAERYTSSPRPEPTYSACDVAMSAAAHVAELNNDKEMIATLDQCGTVAEWVDSLKAYPGAGSLTAYSTEDAHGLLNIVCVHGPKTHICGEAAGEGLLDFDLNDPRLAELNG